MKINHTLNAILPLLIIFTSCIHHSENKLEKNNFITFPKVAIHYAQGFSIDISDSSVIIKTKIPESALLLDSIVLKKNSEKKFQWPLRTVGVQSTTYFAFLERLDEVKKITAVCDLNYYSDLQKSQFNDSITEICGGSFNFEKLAIVHPDMMFLYPFENKGIDRFHQLGITTFYVTEYLEKTPLARAEWLKFFGFLMNNAQMNSAFEKIEQAYNSIKKVEINATIAFNLPFDDQWNMPAGNSITANLIKDAGFDYLLKDIQIEGNHILSKEKAYSILSKADYWIIVAERPADFNLAQLLKENPIYATFPSVKNGKVIFCNSFTTDYFSKGVLEPEIMLKDLLFCQDEFIDKNYQPHYFKLLR
jgi:iron complex transport system substrate-binding protein